MANLSLNGIIDVNVVLTPESSYLRGFNTALIIGASSEKPANFGTIKYYESLEEVLVDFASTTEVYKTASLYFGQSVVPQGVYVSCISVSGNLSTTIADARQANSEWYVAIPTCAVVDTLTTANLTSASSYVESATPATLIAYSFTNASNYLSMMNLLKDGKYTRTISQYDDISTNVENIGKACIAGIIGYAMGKNNNLSNSYTLAYKPVAGLSPINSFSASDLTQLLEANGNVYIKQGYYYNLFRQGKMASGDNFDEIVYLDMLVDQLKSALMDVLINNPKVSQTDQGISTLNISIVNVLESFRDVDFIAPGIWNGPNVLALSKGDALASGYLIQFDSIASQSVADRNNRIAPTCYICIKLAGAIEHIVISLIANK